MSNNSEYTIKLLGEYQRKMQAFEKANDTFILPDTNVVIRIDARRLGASWKSLDDTVWPFSNHMVDALVATTRDLMCIGVKVRYAYTHGDEVSLLLDRTESSGLRRRANLVSLLSSSMSVSFTKYFGHPVLAYSFLSELPTDEHVIDYFMWQRKVAKRNFLSNLFHRILGAQGMSSSEIAQKLNGMAEDEQDALAAELGFPIEEVPPHLLYGAGTWWGQISEYDVNADELYAEQTGDTQNPRPRSDLLLVQASYLHTRDEAYVNFVKQRLDGPAFAAESPGVVVPYCSFDKKKKAPRRENPGGQRRPQGGRNDNRRRPARGQSRPRANHAS